MPLEDTPTQGTFCRRNLERDIDPPPICLTRLVDDGAELAGAWKLCTCREEEREAQDAKNLVTRWCMSALCLSHLCLCVPSVCRAYPSVWKGGIQSFSTSLYFDFMLADLLSKKRYVSCKISFSSSVFLQWRKTAKAPRKSPCSMPIHHLLYL